MVDWRRNDACRPPARIAPIEDVWPGCVYAWLCTSATVQGLAGGRAAGPPAGLEIGPPGQRMSAKDPPPNVAVRMPDAQVRGWGHRCHCLLYTSDAADEEDSVDLGGGRIIKKKK